MNNLTVIYIGNFDLPEVSAAGKRVYGNSLILRDLGCNVILLGKSKTMAEKVVCCSENIIFVGMPNFNPIKPGKYFRWVIAYLRKECIKPDLIIRYGSPAIALFDYLLYRYVRRNGILVVNDVVDWLSAGSTNLFFNIFKSVDTWIEKVVFNKLGDGIIVISHWLYNYYKDYFKSIIILPPLVESYIKPMSANDDPVIVYAGTPFRIGQKVNSKVKDRLDIAVKAIADIDLNLDFKFRIYGLTKDEYLVAYPEQKELINNTDRIEFLGIQPMKVVQKAVSFADYSILLRNRNRSSLAGFSTKVVESISCGTPVIVTDVGDMREYIVDGINGYYVNINTIEEAQIGIIKAIEISKMERDELKMNCGKSNSFLYYRYLRMMDSFIESL